MLPTASMEEFPEMFPQQQITALSIWTGPEEKEIIQVEELLRVARILHQEDRFQNESQLEEIAKSGQEQLEKLRVELESRVLEVSKDGKRLVEQKLKEKNLLRERLKNVEAFMDQNKEQVKRVSELKRKQEEVRNTGWTLLQELAQKTQILESLERNLIIVQRQILDQTQSELKEAPQRHGQPNTRALQDLSEFMKRYNRSEACRCEATRQRANLEEALKRKDEEISSLHRRFHAQKEMEEELAAVEGKLQHQLKEQEERHQKACFEKEEAFEKKVNQSEECFRKELSQMEEHFRKELIEKHKYFRKELSKRHGQFRKELLEKEESTENKMFKMASKEVAERDKKLEKELLERQEKFRKELFQKEKSLKNQVLERVKKELYKKEEDFRQELSKMEENFNKEASEGKKSFLMEVSELEEEFKKKFSERHGNFTKELFKREETFKKEISEKHGKVSEQQITRLEGSIRDGEQKLEQQELQRSGSQQIPESPAAKVHHRLPTLTDLESEGLKTLERFSGRIREKPEKKKGLMSSIRSSKSSTLAGQ